MKPASNYRLLGKDVAVTGVTLINDISSSALTMELY